MTQIEALRRIADELERLGVDDGDLEIDIAIYDEHDEDGAGAGCVAFAEILADLEPGDDIIGALSDDADDDE